MADPVRLRSAAPPPASRLVEVTVAAAANEDVPAALHHVAADTAFAPTGAMSWDGGWRCRFVLRAPEGVMGDAQVFDLLRRIGTRWRWTGVEKIPPAEAARRAAE